MTIRTSLKLSLKTIRNDLQSGRANDEGILQLSNSIIDMTGEPTEELGTKTFHFAVRAVK